MLHHIDEDNDGIPDDREDSDGDGIPNHLESKLAAKESTTHGPAAAHLFKDEDRCRVCSEVLKKDAEGNVLGAHQGGTVMCLECLGITARSNPDVFSKPGTVQRMQRWMGQARERKAQCGAKARGCKWVGNDKVTGYRRCLSDRPSYSPACLPCISSNWCEGGKKEVGSRLTAQW